MKINPILLDYLLPNNKFTAYVKGLTGYPVSLFLLHCCDDFYGIKVLAVGDRNRFLLRPQFFPPIQRIEVHILFPEGNQFCRNDTVLLIRIGVDTDDCIKKAVRIREIMHVCVNRYDPVLQS